MVEIVNPQDAVRGGGEGGGCTKPGGDVRDGVCVTCVIVDLLKDRQKLVTRLEELVKKEKELAKTRAELDDADAALRRLGDQANHLVQRLDAAGMARQRIAEAHHKHVDGHGGTWGECNECGNSWPCPTYVWATTNRDPLATWDPADDDPPQPLAETNPATTAEPAATVHGYTAHGHPCCGEATVGSRPASRARCGGVDMCRDCQAAAGRIHGNQPAAS